MTFRKVLLFAVVAMLPQITLAITNDVEKICASEAIQVPRLKYRATKANIEIIRKMNLSKTDFAKALRENYTTDRLIQADDDTRQVLADKINTKFAPASEIKNLSIT